VGSKNKLTPDHQQKNIVFEIELIKQVEINVDYVLMLVQKWREARGDGENNEIRAEISRAVDSSPSLRNKKDLIENFVDSVSATGEIDDEWRTYVAARREAELNEIIESENLRPDQTRAFIESAFRDGAIQTTGTAITKVLPPVSRFLAGGGHGEKKQRVLTKLGAFFERFFGLSSIAGSDGSFILLRLSTRHGGRDRVLRCHRAEPFGRVSDGRRYPRARTPRLPSTASTARRLATSSTGPPAAISIPDRRSARTASGQPPRRASPSR
jgi:hypothetical protein